MNNAPDQVKKSPGRLQDPIRLCTDVIFTPRKLLDTYTPPVLNYWVKNTQVGYKVPTAS